MTGDAEWLEQPFVQVDIQRLAGKPFDDARQEIGGLVVVGEGGAWGAGHLGRQRQLHQIRCALQFHTGVDYVLQSGGVVHQHPDRDVPLPALPPFRVNSADRLVDGSEPAVIEQQPDGQGDDGLGRRHQMDTLFTGGGRDL
ncbi:hypothetical protein D3C72_1424150 [compost metagenome]